MITKKKIKKKSYSRTVSIIILILSFLGVIYLLSYYNYKIAQHRKEVLSEISRLEKELLSLKEKNEKLKAGISQTQNETYWEREIREQGYVREGERQVVILPPEIEKENEALKEELFSAHNFWQKILQWFERMRD
ncbi:septum formation initiator family protein [bacterium]|nr:septum formation initiator family protein [bacterium]